MFEKAEHLWVVHISGDYHVAERAQEEGFVCIGWNQIGDLATLDTPEALKAAYERAFPDASPASVRASYMQIFRFAHEMKPGDPVVYPIKDSSDILIGEVVGSYEWADDADLRERGFRNKRRVRWLERVPRVRFSQEANKTFGYWGSISTADDYLSEVCQILAQSGQDSQATLRKEEAEADEQVEESTADAAEAAQSVTQATRLYLMRHWSGSKQQFETVVADVFRAMGYTAIVQQGTRDLGVDVIAHADPLGVTPPILKIQAKSGVYKVGAPEVKQLRGALTAGEKGVLVGLGGFSTDARHTEQNDANIILVDADRFLDLFLNHYDRLSPETRHRFPLRQVYVVAS